MGRQTTKVRVATQKSKLKETETRWKFIHLLEQDGIALTSRWEREVENVGKAFLE